MHFRFLQFQSDDGPGRLGANLEAMGVQYEVSRLYRGEPVPAIEGADGLILLGGEMNAEEDAQHPYLRECLGLLQEAHGRGIPTLGVCLGGQLLARSLGARIWRKPATEIGYFPIELTAAGRSDQLFRDLPGTLLTFQWHEDAFDLPEGALLLADSRRDTLQAFRSGRSYGLQFHPEVLPGQVVRWAKGSERALAEAASPTTVEELTGRSLLLDAHFAQQTAILCRNLVALAREASA